MIGATFFTAAFPAEKNRGTEFFQLSRPSAFHLTTTMPPAASPEHGFLLPGEFRSLFGSSDHRFH